MKHVKRWRGGMMIQRWASAAQHLFCDAAKLQVATIETTSKIKATAVTNFPINISGTYSSDITYTNLAGAGSLYDIGRSYFGVGSNIEFKITQTKNNIVGEMSGDYSGDFKGGIDGNTVTFEWHLVGKYFGDRWGKGEWTISDDGRLLQGTWKAFHSGSSAAGNWNMTKIE